MYMYKWNSPLTCAITFPYNAWLMQLFHSNSCDNLYTLQVDQKGSEKKLGEAFQTTINALGSCLVGYAQNVIICVHVGWCLWNYFTVIVDLISTKNAANFVGTDFLFFLISWLQSNMNLGNSHGFINYWAILSSQCIHAVKNIPHLYLSSYFMMDPSGSVMSVQQGVFRTNCIDCLDRTNVVQSMLGHRSLSLQLQVKLELLLLHWATSCSLVNFLMTVFESFVP